MIHRPHVAAFSCYFACLVIPTDFYASFQQGKVEEDRFMRAQDAAKLEAIHKKLLEQAQAAAAATDHDQYQTHILPVMMEIKSVLASSDSLSDESLENLARWKLGL